MSAFRAQRAQQKASLKQKGKQQAALEARQPSGAFNPLSLPMGMLNSGCASGGGEGGDGGEQQAADPFGLGAPVQVAASGEWGEGTRRGGGSGGGGASERLWEGDVAVTYDQDAPDLVRHGGSSQHASSASQQRR
jgi:hypothetical protein